MAVPSRHEPTAPLYLPLDPELDQIRVLTLESSEDSDLLQCTMEVVSLKNITNDYREYESTLPERRRSIPIFDTWLDFIDDRYQYTGTASLETRPETFRYLWGDFVALSYEWGDTLPVEDMVINGWTVQIRANLASALRELRFDYFDGRPKLWADAICINQADIEELNREVKRLGNLFARAWRTLIWVGPKRDDSEKAIDLLQQLSDCPNDEELVKMLSPGSAYVGTGHFRAIYHLLRRSYWDRLWVLQELILSHERSRVLCGPDAISMYALLRACQEMTRDVDLFTQLIANERVAANEPQRGPHIGWNWTAIRLETVPNLREDALLDTIEMITQLMEHSHTSMQARLQDKVYGLLGVLPAEITAQINPDVNAAPQQVYLDFSTAVLRSTEVLFVFSGDNALAQCNPTWVLNLACLASEFIHPLWRKPSFRASGATTLSPRFSADAKLLTCNGYMLDVIGPIESSNLATTCQMPRDRSWMAAQQCSERVDTIDLLWFTISAGCTFQEEPLTEVPSCLRAMPWICNTEFEKFVDQDWLYSYDRSLFGMFKAFCEQNTRTMIADRPLSSYFAADMTSCTDPVASRLALVRTAITDGRQLVVTSSGCLGLCPNSAQPGDVLAILHGCMTPVILRPSMTDGVWQLLGDSYFYGLMDGQVINDSYMANIEPQNITIC